MTNAAWAWASTLSRFSLVQPRSTAAPRNYPVRSPPPLLSLPSPPSRLADVCFGGKRLSESAGEREIGGCLTRRGQGLSFLASDKGEGGAAEEPRKPQEVSQQTCRRHAEEEQRKGVQGRGESGGVRGRGGGGRTTGRSEGLRRGSRAEAGRAGRSFQVRAAGPVCVWLAGW